MAAQAGGQIATLVGRESGKEGDAREQIGGGVRLGGRDDAVCSGGAVRFPNRLGAGSRRGCRSARVVFAKECESFYGEPPAGESNLSARDEGCVGAEKAAGGV